MFSTVKDSFNVQVSSLELSYRYFLKYFQLRINIQHLQARIMMLNCIRKQISHLEFVPCQTRARLPQKVIG